MLLKKSDLREYFTDDEFPLVEEYSYLLKNRWCGYSTQFAYDEFVAKLFFTTNQGLNHNNFILC